MLFDYLKKNYRDGEPIFLNDIHIEGLKMDNFYNQIKLLADEGKIVRYENDIFYMPKQTRFSSSAAPSPETIARYKFISRGGKTNGYYSGSTFANILGLSLQVPMKKEIVSTNMTAIVREVLIGKQTFIVRRTNVPISDKNVKALQLLELLNNLDSYLDCDYDSAKKILKNYSVANHITRTEIDKYIRLYPNSTFHFFHEMRLDHVLA